MNSTKKFTEVQVIQTLDSLGIKHGKRPNSGGWISIDCPFHSASKLESAFINVNHGGFNCFSCHESSNIIQIVMKVRGISYKEALSFLQLENYDYYKEVSIKIDKEEKSVIEEKPKFKFDPEIGNPVEFNPEEWKYTRDRGISKEWLEEAGVKLIAGGIYNDYLLIPITDYEKGIREFEARKIKEFEYLVSYYGSGSEEELKGKWKEEQKKFTYELAWSKKMEEYYVTSIKGNIFDFKVIYLTSPKTRYRNNKINSTVYRREELNTIRPLIIEEGLAADAKNRQIFDNLTCTFGSNLSTEQIEILKQFPELIIIPDNDKASIKMIEKLSEIHPVVKVINKTKDDKESGYLQDLIQSEIIDSSSWLYKQNPLKIKFL